MQKRVLVLNGSYTEIRLIQALKKMGLYVITSGNAPHLSGHQYADEYVCHDYSDYEGMLEIAKEYKIDYVASCANDFGVITAAYIAEKLGLPGHDTFETSRIIAEKDKFKAFAQEHDLLVIPSKGFSDVSSAYQFVENVKFPIIIKPTDLTGGKGVSRADTISEARDAIDIAFQRSKIKNIVIEPYIEGSQHSICTFLIQGKVVTYTSFNEYGAKNDPYLVGYTTSPADNIELHAPVLCEQIEKMASILHLKDGIFHVQYRMHDGKPLIMECMRRCLGNHALLSASFATELEWEEWQARAYCDLDCSHIPHHNGVGQYLGQYYIQAPSNGIVSGIYIAPELNEYISHSIMQWKPGQTIENYCVDKLGFLFFDFKTDDLRNYYADRLNDLISVEMTTQRLKLYSDRLMLKPISIEDSSLILKWRNDVDIKRYFLHQQDITLEEHLSWMQNKVNTGKVCQFIIYLRNSNQPIGSIYIQGIDFALQQGEYGIFIGETEEQGKGYGAEASKLIIQYAFQVLGLKQIYLRVLLHNTRAIQCYKKLGFIIDESVDNQEFIRMTLYRTEMQFLNT